MALLPLGRADASGVVTREGYLTMRDGVQLHFVHYLPSGHGRFPTLFTYDQYRLSSSTVPGGLVDAHLP